MHTNDNQPSEGNVTSEPQLKGTINDPLSDELFSQDNNTDESVNSEKSPINSLVDEVEDSSNVARVAEQETTNVQTSEISELRQSITTGTESAKKDIDSGTVVTTSASLTKYLKKEEKFKKDRLNSYLKKKEEFKENIKKRNFVEAFAAVLQDIVKLDVITVIEDNIEDIDIDYQSLDEIEGLPGQRIITIINLLDGDIKNIIGSRFVEDKAYTQLREFHAEQVNKSHAVLKGNIDCLSTAIKSLLDINKQQDEMQLIPDDDKTLNP